MYLKKILYTYIFFSETLYKYFEMRILKHSQLYVLFDKKKNFNAPML